MNDPSAPVGVSSSSAKLVSWSEGADSAAIHDVSFFLCAILQRTWVSGTVHSASLTSRAFIHRITYCAWSSVLKIIGVSVERMKGERGEIYDKQVVGWSLPKACK